MKPRAWPTWSGSERWTKRKARSRRCRSRRTVRVRTVLSSRIRVVSMLSGQLRFHRVNLVLLAKSAVEPPASWTEVKTDSTRFPAAAWTVEGRRRSSFQVTPCPPVAASIRRPVTMPVWLGSVMVSSRSVRALRVEAPASMRAWRFGVPLRPSRCGGPRG